MKAATLRGATVIVDLALFMVIAIQVLGHIQVPPVVHTLRMGAGLVAGLATIVALYPSKNSWVGVWRVFVVVVLMCIALVFTVLGLMRTYNML